MEKISHSHFFYNFRMIHRSCDCSVPLRIDIHQRLNHCIRSHIYRMIDAYMFV